GLAASRSIGEGFRLALVLPAVGEAEYLRFRMVAVGELDFLGTVAVGVEGRLDLDKAVRAVEDHDLAGSHLRRDVEGLLEIAEIGLHARIDIRAEIRIALGHGLDAQRLLAGHEARADRRVDADIRQATAAEFGNVAHVAGIAVEIGESALDMAELPDRA